MILLADIRAGKRQRGKQTIVIKVKNVTEVRVVYEAKVKKKRKKKKKGTYPVEYRGHE